MLIIQTFSFFNTQVYASELVLLVNIPILLITSTYAFLVLSLTVGTANRMGPVILACLIIFSWFLQILVFYNALKDITTLPPNAFLVVSLTVVTAYQMGHVIYACPFIF